MSTHKTQGVVFADTKPKESIPGTKLDKYIQMVIRFQKRHLHSHLMCCMRDMASLTLDGFYRKCLGLRQRKWNLSDFKYISQGRRAFVCSCRARESDEVLAIRFQFGITCKEHEQYCLMNTLFSDANLTVPLLRSHFNAKYQMSILVMKHIDSCDFLSMRYTASDNRLKFIEMITKPFLLLLTRMRTAGLSHGDMHLENIFIDDENVLKVIDFDDAYQMKEWETDLSFQLEYLNFLRYTCIIEKCESIQSKIFEFFRQGIDHRILDYTSKTNMWNHFECITTFKCLNTFMLDVKKERHARCRGRYYNIGNLKRNCVSISRLPKRICLK